MPDGRLYLYGSLDESTDVYCSQQYRVASTSDLVEWTVHDTAFTSADVPWAGTAPASGRSFVDGASSYADLPSYAIARLPTDAMDMPFEEFPAAVRAARDQHQPTETLLYAPDAIERSGMYYLYFCMSDDSEGVAVSGSPTGPFTNSRRLPIAQIDPAVFVDDDGQAYLYWGQFSANVARLNADMMSLDESSIIGNILTEKDHNFHEGASIRKRDGIYYLVFTDTSRGRPTCLGYATSTSPTGPFDYRGIIIDNAECDPQSWNNHGSIELVDGQWYVFYHRSSRGTASMRRVCAEPIFFDPDGSLPEVKMTSQGPGLPYAPGDLIPAFETCGLTGTARIAPFGTGEAILDMSSGDVATFRYLENLTPITSVEIMGQGTGELDVIVDSVSVGSLHVGSSVAVHVCPGVHEVSIRATASRDLVLDSLRFIARAVV